VVHPVDAIGISGHLLLGIYELGSGVHSKSRSHGVDERALVDAFIARPQNDRVSMSIIGFDPKFRLLFGKTAIN
jgi:hypothetical protein